MGPYRSTSSFLFLFLLSIVIALSGCSSTSSFSGVSSNNQGASQTPPSGGNGAGTPPAGSGAPGTPSGGTGNGGADHLAACGTTNTFGQSITGKVVDAQTGQPIMGTVYVNIDFLSGPWVNVVLAQSDGSFGSVQLQIQKQNFTLTFYAVSSTGQYYVPKILVPTSSCPITQGTDIGTIALTLGTTAQTTALITGQRSDGGPAQIDEIPMALYTSFAGTNWAFSLYPYQLHRETLQSGPDCPANTFCLPLNFGIAASAAAAATYNGASTQFQPVGPAANYVLAVDWNNSSFTLPVFHCTPNEARSNNLTVTPGTAASFGTLNFTGC